MKKIIFLIISTFLFVGCDDSDFETNIPELFNGKYYYINNEGKCENDFLEFLGYNYWESNCENQDRVFNDVTFNVLNNSVINIRQRDPDNIYSNEYIINDYIKITLMNDGTYQFVKSVDGMVLQDLIQSDGSIGESWYMTRNQN